MAARVSRSSSKIRERRTAPRVTERVPLAIGEADGRLQTETNNLSASGAYCTLDRFIAPMTKLQLQIALPGGARRGMIRCRGVVVRVEPVVSIPHGGRYHMAILFTDLAARDRSAIAQFVTRRLASTTSPSTD